MLVARGEGCRNDQSRKTARLPKPRPLSPWKRGVFQHFHRFIFLSNLTNPPRFDHGLERKGKRVTEVIRP
jgi:hypothetical protein